MAVTKIDARPQPKTPKKKVAAYARVSTDNLDQKESLDAQKKHYEMYIKAHSTWEFAGLYFDEGVSGTKSETRNGLQNMLRDCNAGKINYILTKSVSRFARNTVDCLQIARNLKDKGIFIYFEKEHIDTGNMDSELMLSIFSSFAAEESISISENEKWAIRKRFQDGTYKQSYLPYGYVKNENGEMIPDKQEAEIVRWIFNLAINGHSTHSICKLLRERNVPTRKGGKWSSSTVRDMLKNEKYTGDALLQKTYTVDFLNKKRVKNNGIMPQYYVEDSHPAIISKEIFMQVQEEIARRGMLKDVHGRRKCFSAAHAFSQITFCADCGAEFSRLHWNNHGKKSIVWRCSKRLEDYTKCSARTIKEDDLQQAFVEALQIMIGDSDNYLKKLKANLNQIIVDPGALQSIDDRLNKLQHELIDRTERHEDYSDIAEEIFALREQREKVQVSKSSQAEYKKRIKELQFFIKSQPKQMEFDETLARHLLSKITIFDECIVFEFKSGVTVSVEM